MTDQLTFQDPVSRFPRISPPKQDQPEPGLDSDLIPQTDRGQHSYRGTGRLVGRRALITGADSGIGAAVAIAFAREGADIALSYLPSEEPDAQEIKSIIEAAGRQAYLIPGDISYPDFCEALVEEAVSRLGGLDALVNNAGRQIAIEDIADLTDEQWSKPTTQISTRYIEFPGLQSSTFLPVRPSSTRLRYKPTSLRRTCLTMPQPRQQ